MPGGLGLGSYDVFTCPVGWVRRTDDVFTIQVGGLVDSDNVFT